MTHGLSEELLQRLERLAALRDRQALSPTEYKEQKDRILAQASLSDAAVDQPAARPFTDPSFAATSILPGRPSDRSTKMLLWTGPALLLATAAITGLQLLPRDEPARSTSAAPVHSTVKPATSAISRSAKPATPRPTGTAAEMRASGWDETVPDGDGCMMDRHEDARNNLNFVFIYKGGEKPTYEFSFTSITSKALEGATLDAETAPDLRVAVLLDGRRVPAVLQNHYADVWEVEVPVARSIRERIARAKSIDLQLGSDIIARERIQPNPTSIATVDRCLTP